MYPRRARPPGAPNHGDRSFDRKMPFAAWIFTIRCRSLFSDWLRFRRAGYGRDLATRTLTRVKLGKEHWVLPFFHDGARFAPLILVLTALTSCSTVEGAGDSDLVNELVADGH